MYDLLEIHEERRHKLTAEATAERLRPPSRPSHLLATLLRRAADRLEPIPPVQVAPGA
jgi:hypothetical protein